MKARYSLVRVLFLVVALLSVSSPTQAQLPSVLRWAEVDKPGLIGNIIVSPSEVSEIAVGDGDTFYAIDSQNSKVYKSINAGASWTDITSGLIAAGATLPATKVAIAPDQSATVAVVTDGGTKVYLSTNGGATWIDTGVLTLVGTIQCIAISPLYHERGMALREIAIGTGVWGDATTTGQVWVIQIGEAILTWQNQNITVDPTIIGAEVSAIAYSPNYVWDKTILVVASTAGDVGSGPPIDYRNKTWLCIGKRDTTAGTTLWNAPSGYPVEIGPMSGGDDPGVTLTSSIALPSNYLGTEPVSRLVFVSYDRQPDANDDVYRLNDTVSYRLNAAGGSNINISSLAYYGTLNDGKLLAGDVNPVPVPPTVQVRRTFNPLAPAPAVAWQLSSQPPSGPGNARVAWSSDGRIAYCATSQSPGVSLDESAFSKSVDDGNTWEQVSLIDTLLKLLDIAAAPDSKTLFLATYSDFGPESVWRSAVEPLGRFWGRVLTMNTASQRIIFRLSPDYNRDYTIYVTEIYVPGIGSNNLLAVSHTRGSYWSWRCTPGPVIDMVVEDKDTVYIALPGGQICKSTNAGRTWDKPVITGLQEINMLSLAKKGHILAGSRDGKVAYSTDGGATFTKVPRPIGTGDVQVIADARYPENNLIYATTNIPDEGIWRWTLGSSFVWEQIDKSITDLGLGQRVSGLAIGSEGTLYALRAEAVSTAGAGGMTRSLNPSEPLPMVSFDVINRSLPVGTTFNPTAVFSNNMPYLKLSGNVRQNDLWAIDTANWRIYRFSDTLCKSGPVINNLSEIDFDPVTGRNQGFSLAWQPVSVDNQFEVQIAVDKVFTARLTKAEPSTNPFYTPLEVLNPTYYISPGQLQSGTTYYWRVRTRQATTGETIRSQWSDVGSFTVKVGLRVIAPSPGPQPLSPANGSSNITVSPVFSWTPLPGATEYEFILSKDVNLTDIVVREYVSITAYRYTKMLDYGTTYFWQVRVTKPAPSSPSSVSYFTTTKRDSLPPPSLPPNTGLSPVYIGVTVGIVFVLCLLILILVIKTRGAGHY